MGYQSIEELKHLPKDDAKHFYQMAYSRFKAARKGEYFILAALGPLCAGLGAAGGLHFSNETHLGIYLAVIGSGVGHYLMTKLIERKMKPYVRGALDESAT